MYLILLLTGLRRGCNVTPMKYTTTKILHETLAILRLIKGMTGKNMTIIMHELAKKELSRLQAGEGIKT